MRFAYSSFTRRHRWLEGSASRCSWVTEELAVEAGLHSPLLDQSVRLHLDSRLDYSCNHLGVARHVACWQSRRWRWEHFRSAGVPNHFAVLGINPVLGLTLQDICDAYIRAQRHVFWQWDALPLARGPRIPNANQITEALSSFAKLPHWLEGSIYLLWDLSTHPLRDGIIG